MAGYKDFADLNTLTADEVDGYLMQQTVMRFSTTAALVTALGAGVRTGGMLAWADATSTLYQYSGSAGIWLPEASLEKTHTVNWTGPTTLAIGNGTLTCKWRYSGGMVVAHYELVRGASTNAGSANYGFSLPVEAASADWPLGQGLFRDASPSAEYGFLVVPVSSTTVVLLMTATNTRASNTVPVTVATADSYRFTVVYKPVESSAGGAIS